MSDLSLKLPDGNTLQIKEGQTYGDAVLQIGEGLFRNAPYHRLATEISEELGGARSETTRAAGGQKHPGDRQFPAQALPLRAATSSAAMETAISSGRFPPSLMPIGA